MALDSVACAIGPQQELELLELEDELDELAPLDELPYDPEEPLLGPDELAEDPPLLGPLEELDPEPEEGPLFEEPELPDGLLPELGPLPPFELPEPLDIRSLLKRRSAVKRGTELKN